jgi:hypothetical protein
MKEEEITAKLTVTEEELQGRELTNENFLYLSNFFSNLSPTSISLKEAVLPVLDDMTRDERKKLSRILGRFIALLNNIEADN